MKKNKNLKSGSGVSFYRNVEMSCKKKPGLPYLEQGVNLCLLLISVCSLLIIFVNTLQISIRPSLFTTVLCLEALLLWSAFLKKSIRVYTIPAVLLIFAAFVFFNFKDIREGFAGVANSLIRNINSYYEMDLKELSYSSSYDLLRMLDGELEQKVQTAFMLAASFAAVLPQAVVICGGGNRWLYFLSSLFFLAPPFAVGLIPQPGYFLLFIIVAAAVLGNGFRLQPEIRAKIKLFLLSAAGLSCLFAFILLPGEKYKDYKVEAIKLNMQDRLQEFMEGDLLGLSVFPERLSANGGLSGGKLGDVDSVSFNNREALEVWMPLSVTDKFYLRGFIGTGYTSDEWTALNREDAEEYKKIKEETKGELANLQSQKTELAYRLYHKLEKGFSTKEEWDTDMKEFFFGDWIVSDTELLTIKNKQKGDKGIYAPYLITEPLEPEDDGRFRYQGKQDKRYRMDFLSEWEQIAMEIAASDKRYGKYIVEGGALDKIFDAYLNSDFGEAGSLGEDILSYRERERAYRDYVNTVYTKLPDQGAQQALKAFRDYGSEDIYTVFELKDLEIANQYLVKLTGAMNKVKSFLKENAVYDLSPGKVPDGKDFIDYFLLENKKGYCAYYATSATVLFRSLGIPARYVEGYVVTKNDIENAKKNDSGQTAIIRDTNAHAWTEIYVNGWGWVPVEVTPGYEGGSLPREILLKNIADSSGAWGKEQNPYASMSPQGNKAVNPTPAGMDISQNAKEKSILTDLPSWARLLLLIFSLAAAVLLAIFGRSLWLHLKGKGILSGGNRNKKQIYLYGQLSGMLAEACYLGSDFILEEQYREVYKIVPDMKGLERFVEASRRAAFGAGRLSEEEWEWSHSFYRRCRTEYLKNAGCLKRFYYRFIRCYY